MIVIKKRVTYFLTATVLAYAWFTISAMVYFDLSDRNVLTATIINFAAILFALIEEKIELYFYKKKKAKEVERTILSRFIDFWMYGASLKSALYLYYIGILICTAFLAAEPDFPYLSEFKGYFQSVEYGILILVAADVFIDRLSKDVIEKDKIVPEATMGEVREL